MSGSLNKGNGVERFDDRKAYQAQEEEGAAFVSRHYLALSWMCSESCSLV